MSPGQTKRRKNLFFSIHSDGHFWGVLMRIKVKLNNNLVQFTDLAISFLLFFMKIAPFFSSTFFPFVRIKIYQGNRYSYSKFISRDSYAFEPK
jgi:hypothetical protein